MRRSIALAFALILALGTQVVTAQEDEREPKPESSPSAVEARQHMEKLRADFNADLKKARDDVRREMEEALRKIEEAKAAGKPMPAMPAMRMGPPPEVIVKHLPRFQKAAAKYQGQNEALPFLSWIMSQAPGGGETEAAVSALKTVETDHLKSDELHSYLRMISGRSQALGAAMVETLLRRVEKEHPDASTRARAILERVRRPLTSAPIGQKAYLYARSEALRAAEVAARENFRSEVQSIIDGREKLIPGKVAPDISGVDLDGVAFKLSDYRGKVILLDFWGDW